MKKALLVMSLVAFIASCSESTTPTVFRNVQVSFATQPAATLMASMSGTAIDASGAILDDTLVTGTDTLIITSAQIVLREIELKRIDVADCDNQLDDDGCEEFETGPVLVSLPLTPGVEAEFELDIPPGTYSEIEFDVHKVEDEPSDITFLQQHPEFDKLSIRVMGSYNGNAFLFESDLGVEQELDLVPALVVEEGAGSTNITVFVDIDAWFRDQSGDLIDPDTANEGGSNRSLVEDNIKQSMEAFEDDDRSGSS
jgi:hypothetical protein